MENQEENVIDLSGDGGVLKKILKAGDGEQPPNGANVIGMIMYYHKMAILRF